MHCISLALSTFFRYPLTRSECDELQCKCSPAASAENATDRGCQTNWVCVCFVLLAGWLAARGLFRIELGVFLRIVHVSPALPALPALPMSTSKLLSPRKAPAGTEEDVCLGVPWCATRRLALKLSNTIRIR